MAGELRELRVSVCRRAARDDLMRLLVSWLREFVDVDAPAEAIAERLGQRGFELSAVEPFGDGDAVIDLEDPPTVRTV